MASEEVDLVKHSLVEFIDDLAYNMQNGGQIDVAIMDFSKAFDKVGHQRLLLKLDHYGIRGKTNKWMQAFLTKSYPESCLKWGTFMLYTCQVRSPSKDQF